MAQIKIYGERQHLSAHRERLSDAIHHAAVDTLGLPENKRFHRFIGLDPQDLVRPPDRTAAYTIIEVSLFEGRSPETKRAFLETLMQRVTTALDLEPADLEITLFETPRSHWGIRGQIGDVLTLPYEIRR